MKIQLFLQRWQIDHAMLANFLNIIGITDTGFVHHFKRFLYGATDTGFTNEHMMCLFGQHKAAGTGQRIES